jgi:7,8-dihydro-6-hydroxymethylpterin dimethyltransferase
MLSGLARLAQIVREPVLPESRVLLRQSWESLPAAHRTLHQMYGKQGNACGATIGAMPRCDFACRGCYLGEEANHIPSQPVDEIRRQMRLLRVTLGPNGNLQLTDGEVTLRDEAELCGLLRYADEIGLVPMLMTHGDTFRRKPGLLERLMEQGGLREVSIHVDTTMQGRIGAYRNARTEAELNPLRDEFAEMIRSARRATGRPLAAATTMTVTPDNLDGVPDALRGAMRNSDVFKMISFQPAAQVGRTVDGLGDGIDVEDLWRRIASGLGGPARETSTLLRGQMWLGHSACNRYVHGFALSEDGAPPDFYPLRLAGDAADEATIEGYLRRFGGASFRRDTKAQARARLVGLFLRAPAFWLGRVLPYFWRKAGTMAPDGPGALVFRLLRGRARVQHFNIVSHHFMSRAQIETPLGQERLKMCVFMVPVGERLVSMCEVNALGVRESLYASMRRPGTAESRAS